MSDTNNSTKFVRFAKYCPHCVYSKLPENYDPCCLCLDDGGREGTCKPSQFEKWDKKSRRPEPKKQEKKEQKMGKITVIDT